MKEPKLRFLADDGSSFPDLKEKRLNDVCEYNKGQSVGVNYVGTENMKQDFSGVNNLDSENEVKGVAYNIGDTLMSNIRSYLKKTWKADVNGVCSTDVLVFHPTDINNDYLYRNISSEKFISYVMTAAKGSKMPRGDKEHIMNYDIQVPCLSEQQKIASLFTELDKLIQSAEKELDGYRELKRGMLQKMFPKKGEKVPEIRFPEFSGDWEQRKLGDLSESFEYGLNAAATEYDGKNKYIRITDIDDDSREFKQDDVTSPAVELSNADNYKLSYGDILFARTGASVGKSYIYKNSDGLVYYAGFLIRAKIKKDYNPEFVFQNTLTNDYKKFIKLTSMRTGQPGVNAQEYSQYQIMIPCKAEQDKISDYLRSLDNLIALHQKELEGYKELKKGLLQQMFC